MPDNVISKPPKTINGEIKIGRISKNIHIKTKTIGTAMCTFIGLYNLGFFHRRYNKPDTDRVTKSDSTMVQYWINI